MSIQAKPTVRASDWKRTLQDIINRHNGQHGARDKVVSHRTRDARAMALFRMFNLLRTLGYKMDPRSIGERHVRVLVWYWTRHPAAASLPHGSTHKVELPEQPLSPAYIQQQLSILRVFCDWIGKPGMVRPPETYVEDRALVARSSVAERDHGWSANGVDLEEVYAMVAIRNEFVAVQLRVLAAFGLRRKEAVMFRPHVAEVPAWAVPPEHAGGRFLCFLPIKRGTKGGRLRYVAVRTTEQVRALEEARRLVRREDGYLGQPGHTLKQSLDLFSNTIRSCGITKNTVQTSAHGLRHEFAGDLFYDVTELPAPVRASEVAFADPDMIRAGYLEVARQLAMDGIRSPALTSVGVLDVHDPLTSKPRYSRA